MKRIPGISLLLFVLGLGLGPQAEVHAAPGRAAQVTTAALTGTAEKTVELAQESVKFYTAVATVHYWECVRTKDPTVCENFIESLKDPGTHVGFTTFILVSQGTSRGIYTLSRGILSGSFLGLAAGSLVNEFFTELYTSPTTRELLSLNKRMIRDPDERFARRKELLNQLMTETVGSGAWWIKKVPNLLSLLGAAALSPLVLPVGMVALSEAEDISRFILKNSRAAEALSRARASIAAYQAVARTGASMLRILSMRNGYLFALMAVGEMVMFLDIASWLEHPIRKWWDERVAAKDLGIALGVLRIVSEKPRSPQTEKELAEAIANVEKSWDAFRSSQMIISKKIQSQYLQLMESLETPLTETYMNYLWVMEGAPRDADKMKQPMPLHWEPGGNKDAMEARESFFCGVEPEDAAKSAIQWNGLLLPGFGDRFRPFRVSPKKRVCPLVGSGDAINDFFHERYLKETDYGPALDLAIAKAFSGLETVRKEIYARYEGRITSSALDGLSGTENGKPREDYEYEPGRKDLSTRQFFKRGVLASYDQEISFWNSIGQYSAADRVRNKKEAAEGFHQYVKNPGDVRQFPSNGNAELAALFEPEKTPTLEQWQKVVADWKSFTLGQAK